MSASPLRMSSSARSFGSISYFFLTAVPEMRSPSSTPSMSCRPTSGLNVERSMVPSTMRSPPTPVETVIYAQIAEPFPAPWWTSPTPAAAVSCTIRTGAPSMRESSFASGKSPQPGRMSSPFWKIPSITNQREHPTIFAIGPPAAAVARRTIPAIASCGSRGVGTLCTSPMTPLSALAMRMLVPPRSKTMSMPLLCLIFGKYALCFLPEFGMVLRAHVIPPFDAPEILLIEARRARIRDYLIEFRTVHPRELVRKRSICRRFGQPGFERKLDQERLLRAIEDSHRAFLHAIDDSRKFGLELPDLRIPEIHIEAGAEGISVPIGSHPCPQIATVGHQDRSMRIKLPHERDLFFQERFIEVAAEFIRERVQIRFVLDLPMRDRRLVLIAIHDRGEILLDLDLLLLPRKRFRPLRHVAFGPARQ